MAGISQQTKERSSEASLTENYQGPLVVVTLLFFMWGFITCMNDILIPKLQQVFTLQLWQAMLIQTAFFGAYFIVSLLYFIFSVTKGDPIQKIGYKNGIIVGLIVSAIGCALFFPAASLLSYGFFLLALFILASGITILQIAANPYVTILGPPDGAASRLNLTQALNSLGTTVAPIIGGYLIFEGVNAAQQVGADSVKLPYLGLAGTLLLIAIMIKVAKLPRVEGDEQLTPNADALKYRHLVLGIGCIFAYVGGEVAIGSTLINFFRLPEIAGLEEAEAGHYLAFYWGGAMIGRFFGAVALAQFRNNSMKYVIIAVISAVAFALLYSIYGLEEATIGLGLIALNFVVLLLGGFIPSRTLGFFAATVIGLLLFTCFGTGQVAMWSVIAIGLFNSIMFPTIFTLAIKGLGVHTSQGSSLLVMAIVGGAIIPPVQGLVADLTGNLQLSFLVPMACYLYIVYYGFIGSKVKKVGE
ncbi:FHS family L-fucose permease-like MFS transporter [Pontibacter ummariensis]|uniref:MFS transporter, FHS family, L-fucose permease n=1 Tax=Pontibacter ummariensis TaxID=1610492 RepID=A0A239I730_9BACT|nr:sugar MFS transporter [Pontibacter ummariensis]PRY10014.1 FHS family L-fucose permease-like MFS transporter [Pontibacter ummariensis]SNS89291.1 MFS transporter, FHS family, L-fucose permease [Pontibacter ummariensis]